MRNFLLLASAVSADHECDQKWSEFLSYSSTEESSSVKTVFCENLKHMTQLEQDDPSASYSHLGPFAAIDPTEFESMMGLDQLFDDVSQNMTTPFLQASSSSHVPTSFDWTSIKGVVNPIRNQWQCNAGWAFSVIANVEGAYSVQTGNPLMSLSEQHLVTCTIVNGCKHGFTKNAFEDLVKKKTLLVNSEDYPYRGDDSLTRKCKHPKGVLKVKNFQWVKGEANAIRVALIKYGPLSAFMNANGFQFYSHGIMSDSRCRFYQKTNHGVNIVGYGTKNGIEYWKGRNSWGTKWGESGYFRITIGKCSINKYVFTATDYNKKPCDKFCLKCGKAPWCSKCKNPTPDMIDVCLNQCSCYK